MEEIVANDDFNTLVMMIGEYMKKPGEKSHAGLMKAFELCIEATWKTTIRSNSTFRGKVEFFRKAINCARPDVTDTELRVFILNSSKVPSDQHVRRVIGLFKTFSPAYILISATITPVA